MIEVNCPNELPEKYYLPFTTVRDFKIRLFFGLVLNHTFLNLLFIL